VTVRPPTIVDPLAERERERERESYEGVSITECTILTRNVVVKVA